MLIGHPEEVSLRPSANSMMFKQTNINPNLPLNSGMYFNQYEILFNFLEICLFVNIWLKKYNNNISFIYIFLIM